MTEVLEVSQGGVDQFLTVIPDRAWIEGKISRGEIVIVERKVNNHGSNHKN